MPNSSLLTPGSILNDRYQILRQLGSGGFGRTYLAEDRRYSEKCVLKEFAPQVDSRSQFQKAEELLKREAEVLKKLRHDQIPRFRKLLKLNQEKDSLFLVQDYVEGQSYWEQVRQGKRFTEAQVTQILRDILPVLEYIHSLNLVHRDISPDNLIQRATDDKPVLIDFGCVKVAARVVTGANGVTLVGKQGYAPEEQMFYGRAFPHSDLYALAVTLLVLLTGKQPDELYDRDWLVWRWQQEVTISSELAALFDKMLARQPGDRFQSASEVRRALERQLPSTNPQSQLRTLVVAPANPKGDRSHSDVHSAKAKLVPAPFRFPNMPRFERPALPLAPAKYFFKFLRGVGIGVAVLTLPAIIAFASIRGLMSPQKPAQLSLTEQEQQQQIHQRIKALGANESQIYQQVDDLFYEKYPELKGTSLADRPDQKKFREAWYKIADRLLKQLEQKS